MKKIKLLFSCLFIFVFILLGFSTVKINATNGDMLFDENIKIEGASIRTTGEVGLRFVGNVTGLTLTAKKYGMVLSIAPETSTPEALKRGTEGVLEGTVTSVSELNQYSVTLIKIPETAYVDKISARAFVVTEDGKVYYGNEIVTRSLVQVALLAKNNGETADLSNIINYVDENYVLVSNNYKGNLEVKSDLFEINHKNLEKRFIYDWNKKFGTNFSDLVNDAKEFQKSAATGITTTKVTIEKDGVETIIDVETSLNSNLRKFFNNSNWTWVLKYIESVSGSGHPQAQIQSIFNEDGISHLWGSDRPLYKFGHLLGSLINFFRGDELDLYYLAPNYVSFKDINQYKKIEGTNTSLYIDITDYDIKAINSNLVLEEPSNIANGYEFDGYTADDKKIEGLNYKLTNQTVELLPVVKPTEYKINLYYNGQLVDQTNRFYTIENETVLPIIDIEGKAFIGWHTLEDLSDEIITTIPAGQTGDKAFYGEYKDALTTSITFKYNDPKSNKQIIDEFIEDVKRLANVSKFLSDNTTGKAGYSELLDYKPILTIVNDSAKRKEINDKWGWLINEIGDIVINSNKFYGNDIKALFTDSADTWNDAWRTKSRIYTLTQSLKGIYYKQQFDFGSVILYDWSKDESKNIDKITNFTISPDSTKKLEVKSKINELPVREGYTFEGWYDNAECSGTAVTNVPEVSKTLYAKWTPIA